MIKQFSNKIKALTIFSLLSTLSSCYILAPIDKEKYSDIEGHVFSLDTNAPVSNARVSVVNELTSNNTDRNGRFIIRGMPVQWMTVEIAAPGHETLRRKVKVEPLGSKYIDFWVSRDNAAVKGEKVVFERDGNIWVSDEYGINQTNLTEKIDPNSFVPESSASFSYHHPVWYENKNKIAYIVLDNSVNPNTMNGIWVMNTQGKMNQRITYVESQAVGLSVTDIGSSFLFSMINPDNATSIGLYRYDRGKNKTENLSGYISREMAPRFSPNGKTIAYSSNITERALLNTYDTNQYTGSRAQIFTMGLNGNNKKQLTMSGENYDPAWSPDGEKIAFISTRNGSSELWVMNKDGSGQRSLTTTGATKAANPSWSGNGERIIFNTNYMQKYPSMTPKEAWIFSFSDFSLKMASSDALTPDW